MGWAPPHGTPSPLFPPPRCDGIPWGNQCIYESPLYAGPSGSQKGAPKTLQAPGEKENTVFTNPHCMLALPGPKRGPRKPSRPPGRNKTLYLRIPIVCWPFRVPKGGPGNPPGPRGKRNPCIYEPPLYIGPPRSLKGTQKTHQAPEEARNVRWRREAPGRGKRCTGAAPSALRKGLNWQRLLGAVASRDACCGTVRSMPGPSPHS